MAYQTDAARWRALSIRDPAANNQFVYTVKSTNVYCRPICPARLARRANVGFCSTPAEAAAAGFRACKRCKPDVTTTIEEPQEKAVAKACALIEEALKQGDSKAFRLQDLAKNVGLTPRYFHKVFKDRMGVTPKEWAKGRMQEREAEMRTPSLVLDSPPDLETFNLDEFDFNELVDFEGDAGMTMDIASTTAAVEPTILPLVEGFGDEISVNTSMLSWGALALDPLDPGLSLGDDKLSKWADVTANSDDTMPMTSATFEHDAALLLSAGHIPDLSQGMYVNTFG
ncbi:hypothetical protein N0V90_012713 [Kalmusia sp. IMI 367209]|nr:hypothetical protein N0V90_012713 [Kalmusia sp. IMI 367209]